MCGVHSYTNAYLSPNFPICTYINTCIYTRTCIPIHSSFHQYLSHTSYIHISTSACTNIFSSFNQWFVIYMHTDTCACAQPYTHTYIHTRMHAYIPICPSFNQYLHALPLQPCAGCFHHRYCSVGMYVCMHVCMLHMPFPYSPVQAAFTIGIVL